MDTVQLIVECTMDEERERLICQYGTVKYRLPVIDSYVVEIPKKYVNYLRGIESIKSVHQTTHITAQMNSARRTIGAAAAKNHRLTGRGISLAILDTGVAPIDDFTKPQNRIIAFKDILNNKKTPYDDNGHGTHVTY